ncbi:hypothetical protein NLI96_g6575 [Meripilus lineatus]|uniref:Survival protein SurE-like phosphatase/nucleotidase domain-containing protein n=1 Tax=Meripilus lineatus TaxID=2056292 RepID=A0AAD5YFT0_9APHY|nr:hypothetical protein NLI96_g6575 [Physisporinus lineatus]
MLTSLLIILPFVLVGSAQKILLTNDDGWAVAQIRAQFNALEASKYIPLLSAPAQNQSGSGSKSAPPTKLTKPCEFNTCPVGSPPVGHDAADSRLNYVNSFPVDAVRYGIQTLSPTFFSGNPDLVVSGPNAGSNLGEVEDSGTVGAACEAALEGVPSIAVSGRSTHQVSYTTLMTEPNSNGTKAALLYSQLTIQVANALFAIKATPLLPSGITLNINYPSFSKCPNIGDYQFILTRLVEDDDAVDVKICDSDQLPDEESVVTTDDGCYASVSVIDARTKADVSAEVQGDVLSRFPGTFFSCYVD